MSRYFVNTGDGVEYYDSLVEAETAAQNAIDGWRDCCDPEWPEEVESVCYGKVLGQSESIDVEGGDYVKYELTPLIPEYRCDLCGGVVSFDGTKPGASL